MGFEFKYFIKKLKKLFKSKPSMYKRKQLYILCMDCIKKQTNMTF